MEQSSFEVQKEINVSAADWKYKDANAPGGNDSGASGATTKEKGNFKHYQKNIIHSTRYREGRNYRGAPHLVVVVRMVEGTRLS
jgi:hypothetical protein